MIKIKSNLSLAVSLLIQEAEIACYEIIHNPALLWTVIKPFLQSSIKDNLLDLIAFIDLPLFCAPLSAVHLQQHG